MSQISNQPLMTHDDEFSQIQPTEKKDSCPPPPNCCLWFTIIVVILTIIINIYNLFIYFAHN